MAIIYTLIIMSIASVLLFGEGYFSYWLIRKVFLKDEAIIVPSLFSCNGGLCILISILLLTCILIDELVYSPYEINIHNVEEIIPFFIAATVICFYENFLSFSIFENDKIIHRNIFHSFGKVYNYYDIIKVQVYIKCNYRFPIWNILRYIIEMKD